MGNIAAFMLGFAACYVGMSCKVYFGILLPMSRGAVANGRLVLSALAWPLTVSFRP